VAQIKEGLHDPRGMGDRLKPGELVYTLNMPGRKPGSAACHPPEELEKWLPQEDDLCEGVGVVTKARYRGKFFRRSNGEAVLAWVSPAGRDTTGTVSEASLRPVVESERPPAAPPEVGKCVACGQAVVSGQVCKPCHEKRSAKAVAVEAPKPDPYAACDATDVRAATDEENGRRRLKRKVSAYLQNGYILTPNPDGTLPVVGLEINKLCRAEKALDKLAAKRADKCQELLREFDSGPARRASVQHPSTWPSHGSGPGWED
jgi:hypothetical protein